MGVEPAETVAPAAKDFAVIFNKVVEASEQAKLSMKVQADKHQNPAPDYKVTRVTPNVVELKLPKTLRIHPVVNVSRVKPYLGPLPGQPVSQPGPVQVFEEHNEEYEVAHRLEVLSFHVDFISYLEIWQSGSSGICGALIALLH
ncbi:hypothetical protein SCLCIDRAFT_134260 [Scleroderma citrinum Foug A]|uniref:Uncharacterized protein n=1 Tax=Scleroderma citrinum Foug A TaxID=1036808 RepID=A0A0C3DH34_9AGAM|nr:hypothetical protein SCLCIDRAFT_134260 [Scleroderma citrinum Foug A]